MTAYAALKKTVTYEEVKAIYDKYYQKEKVCACIGKRMSARRQNWVEGSNYVDVNFKIDERTNRIIMMGAMDNLVKWCGRSGGTEHESDVWTAGDDRT